MKTMKRTLLVGASMFAMLSGVYAQTGTAQDFEAYQSGWIQTNNVTQMTPALYEQMKSDWTSSVQAAQERQPATEMSATEKQAILDADLRVSMGVPADYPLMQNTGNPTADADAYQQAKAAWIQNNEAGYVQMRTNSTLTEAERQQIRQQEVLNNQNN